MARNSNLINAKKNKKDEFYTQLTDIEKELKHYKEQFKGKVVLCNCDNPEKSNFWFFFKNKFVEYGLKRLISTHLSDQSSYKLEIIGDQNNDGIIDENDIIKTPLEGIGDFRDKECIDLLDESDIICTNPPFSLFKEYLTLLIDHNKKFLILGNNNAISYLGPLIKENKLWLGYTSNKTMEFEVPNEYEGEIRDCRKYAKVPAISWFTNLETNIRKTPIPDSELGDDYDPKKYPKYDNYDAIDVSRIKDIPKNYTGVMGVPISFLSKYCPDQFEIIGVTYSTDKSPEIEAIRTDPKHRHNPFINGKEKFMRILIRHK